jgi:hypothetical protein
LFDTKKINKMKEIVGGRKIADPVRECTTALTQNGETLKSDPDQSWDSGDKCDYEYNTDGGTDCPPIV